MLDRVTKYSHCTLDYARLERITQVEKPYRGTTNKYPLVDRKQSYKCFYKEEVNGEIVYKISRDSDYNKVVVTKAEYGVCNADKSSRIHGRCYEQVIDGVRVYYKYATTPAIIGIVYPDNSIEFTGSTEHSYYQGTKKAFSSDRWLPCVYMRSSIKHGGLIISNGDFTHPMFKGLRVYVNTLELHETCSYEVHGYKSNIKAVKQAFMPYKDSFSAADVMVRSMDEATLLDIIRTDVPESALSGYGNIIASDIAVGKIYTTAMESIIDNPLIAILSIAVMGDVREIKQRVNYTTSYNRNTLSYYSNTFVPDKLIPNTAKLFKHRLCKANPSELLNEVVYPAGGKYPSSEWGYSIMRTGILVEQYK